MTEKLRIPVRCIQCHRHFPSQEFIIRNVCIRCFMVAIFDSMVSLNKKTLPEQKDILRKVEYGLQGMNAAIRREIRTISKMIERKE